MAKKQPKFSFIMMTCGYVESSQTSWLMYGTHFLGGDGFDTRAEAITELALDLYAKYYEECLSIYERRYSKDVKECCREALIKDKKANFCSVCGSNIQDGGFDPIGFREYVRELHNSTCDSYGDAEWANDRDLVWWPWSAREFRDAPKESVIWIVECAEDILLAALYDAKPELKSDEHDDYRDFAMRDWDTFKENKQPSYT